MTSLFAIRILLFAAECFAASSAVAVLAWLAAFRLGRASLRHLVWAVAFGVLIALPVAGLLVPAQFVLARTVAEETKVPVLIAEAGPVPDMAPVDVAPSDPAPAPAPKAWRPDASDLVLGLACVWLLGVVWALGRLALGALGLAALRRRSRPHAIDPADLPPLGATRRECELRLSQSEDGPMTWGVLAPVVLLPRSAVAWPRERLHAVLLHELAHVRRKDSLTRALSLLVCVFYWPNPMVWMAAKALRREAEIAADDAVVAAGVKPSVYAGELLSLASEFRAPSLAAAMAQRSALETRVKSVLEPNVSRKGVTAMDVVKTACLGVAAAAVLAVLRPDIVDAQSAPPAPPAPPAVMADPADVPPPPPAPEAPDAALPAPPPVSAVPPVPPVPPAPHIHMSRRIVIDDGHGNVRVQVHVDQAEIDRAMAEARRAEQELARIQPEIQKALAAAKVDARVAKALEKSQPEIEAEVARAMARVEPEVRRAMAQAKVSEHVRIQMEKARSRIEAARIQMGKDAEDAGAEDQDEDQDRDDDRDDGK